MRDRIKTLILDAHGPVHWSASVRATILQGFLGIEDGVPLKLECNHHPLIKKTLRFLRGNYEPLSYVSDWKEALCNSPRLDVQICNINNRVALFRSLKNIAQFELIIILHHVANYSIYLDILNKMAGKFNNRRGKLAVFVGNEYSRMEQKIHFIRASKADYICSQLPIESARWLYAEAKDSQVIEMAHALNPRLYRPQPNIQRTVDIGFIGTLYHLLIGDMERTNLVQFFERNGPKYGLICDIRDRNVPQNEWMLFLNKCKTIVGAESGTYYLDRTGQAIEKAGEYYRDHKKDWSFDEVFNLCFRGLTNYVSGKCVSSRHFEPIGTKTCQILIEGYYNGILIPDEHFISVKKDISNIEDAIERYKDEDYRKKIIKNAYQYVMDNHTHKHRVEALIDAVE
ncbi:glycosyltransferase [bacterium]|nr:glycosyltransferase [bacterium]